MSMEPKMNFLASLEKSLAEAVTAAELPGVMRRIRDALDGYEMTQREEYRGEDDLLKIYTSAMVVQGRSQKTIDRYVYIIKRLTTETGVPAGRITIHHIWAWLAKEQDRGIRDTTLEGYRQVFSAYFGWLQRESLIDRNPTANLGAIKCAKVRKEAFVEVDMEKLKRECRDPRDLAIVLFLRSTGCRISEAVGLNREDVDLQGLSCVVRGKGNKERRVYLDSIAGLALKEYLGGRKDDLPALFIGKRKERFTPSGVRRMLKRVAERAGVENVHPHRFRRTLATSLSRHGMPIQEVAAILGHEKIDTTMRYVEMDDDNIRSAYRRYA